MTMLAQSEMRLSRERNAASRSNDGKINVAAWLARRDACDGFEAALSAPPQWRLGIGRFLRRGSATIILMAVWPSFLAARRASRRSPSSV